MSVAMTDIRRFGNGFSRAMDNFGRFPDEFPNGAVVAPDLAVHSIEGLSVCDASVMPTMTSGNINAPVIMMAEKGVDLIRARHSKFP